MIFQAIDLVDHVAHGVVPHSARDAFVIDYRGSPIHEVVGVGLGFPKRRRHMDQAILRIVGEGGLVPVGVHMLGLVAVGIVYIRADTAHCIRDRNEMIHIIIIKGSGALQRMVFNEFAAHHIVDKGASVKQRICHGDLVAILIVLVVRDVPEGI